MVNDTNNIFTEDPNSEFPLLSPKGILYGAMLEAQEVQNTLKVTDPEAYNNFEFIEETWSRFENYIRRNYGHGDSFGAIMFDCDGGHCVSINPQNNLPPDKEDTELPF